MVVAVGVIAAVEEELLKLCLLLSLLTVEQFANDDIADIIVA